MSINHEELRKLAEAAAGQTVMSAIEAFDNAINPGIVLTLLNEIEALQSAFVDGYEKGKSEFLPKIQALENEVEALQVRREVLIELGRQYGRDCKDVKGCALRSDADAIDRAMEGK